MVFHALTFASLPGRLKSRAKPQLIYISLGTLGMLVHRKTMFDGDYCITSMVYSPKFMESLALYFFVI